MELTSAKTVKNLLESRQIRPSRGLGQNFLLNKAVINKIIVAGELTAGDTVLEIGPGLGVLTRELAKLVKRVVAVEKDRKMVAILKETPKDYGNAEIIEGDILKISEKRLAVNPGCKIIGNLPFYLTAPVIRRFLESVDIKPQFMVLVVQKEVAQRICAKPPDMNLLAVSVQFYAQPKIISCISRESFWPQPAVDAAIIKITPSVKPGLTENTDLFFKIVKAGFCQPRKQLANNLSKKLKVDKLKVGEWLISNNIRPEQRAETLSVDDWLRLTKNRI